MSHDHSMLSLATNVDSIRLRLAIETQSEVVREEQSRVREIEARAAAARQTLADCSTDHDACSKRLSSLQQGIGVLQDLLNLTEPKIEASVAVATSGEDQDTSIGDLMAKPVARLGPQHYLMLAALRARPGATAYDLSAASDVLYRRVKAVMSRDLERGYVTTAAAGFSLTPIGLDLLERFEAYRRSDGKPLPSRETASVGDVENEQTEEDFVT